MSMLIMSDFIISSHSCSRIIKEFESTLRWKDDSKQLQRKIQELVEIGLDIHDLDLGEEFWHCSALHLACEVGNEAAVTILIDSYGAHIDILKRTDIYGDTPLHYASKKGPTSILKQLLEFVCHEDVDVPTMYNEETPLHWAVEAGLEEKARLLINMGANVHGVDWSGRGLMHFAINSVKMLQFAKENSVDVNQKTVYGFTTLHLAVYESRAEVVQWLIQNGADTTTKDSSGRTPLHMAAMYGLEDIDTFLELAVATQDVFRKEVDKLLQWLEEKCGHAHVERLLQEILLRGLWELIPHISRGIAIYAGPKFCEQLHWLIRGTKDQVSNLFLKEDGLLDSIAKLGNMNALKPVLRLASQKMGQQEVDRKLEETFRISLIENRWEFAMAVLKQSDRNQLPAWIKNIKYYHLGIPETDDLFAQMRRKAGRNHNEKLLVDEELPLAYLAFHSGKDHIVNFIQQYMPNFVNEIGTTTKRSALHWATILGRKDIVEKLCNIKECKGDLLDFYQKSPYQYANEDIRTVLEFSIKDVLQPFYKERELYVYALVGILVGSALISGITFSRLLQPPLGYPDRYGGYVSTWNAEVVAFFSFNCLSFFLSMATTLAAAKGILPSPELYIRDVVKNIRRSLIQAAILLGLSIFFSLVAFSSAGLSVVPPTIHRPLVMIVSISLAGIVSIAFLVHFFWGISVFLPEHFIQWLPRGCNRFCNVLQTCS